MRWRRHSWRDVNPQACRHNARLVFDSRSGKGVRAAYVNMAKEAFKPYEGMVGKVTPT